MKITMKTSDVLSKAEAFLAEMEADEESYNLDFQQALVGWALEVKDNLLALAKRIEIEGTVALTGGTTEDDLYELQSGWVRVGPKYPKPVRPNKYVSLYLYNVRRDVEALKASTKDTLSIGPEDNLYRYLADPEEGR